MISAIGTVLFWGAAIVLTALLLTFGAIMLIGACALIAAPFRWIAGARAGLDYTGR